MTVLVLFILPSQVFVLVFFFFLWQGIFKNAPKKSTRSVVDLFANAIFFKEKSYLDITKNIVLPTVGIYKRLLFWQNQMIATLQKDQ